MDDIPWPLVVMVFIGFIGWVRNRIREAAETRRQRAAIRRGEMPEENSYFDVEEEPWLATEEEVDAERNRRRSEKEPEVHSTLRDLMSQMREHEQEQTRQEEEKRVPPPSNQRSSTAAATPPPLPDKSMKIELADVEGSNQVGKVADVGGLGKHAKIPQVAGVAGVAKPPSNSSADAYHSNRKQSNPTVKRVVKSFRDRKSIQSAFILKEILDTPKGLE